MHDVVGSRVLFGVLAVSTACGAGSTGMDGGTTAATTAADGPASSEGAASSGATSAAT